MKITHEGSSLLEVEECSVRSLVVEELPCCLMKDRHPEQSSDQGCASTSVRISRNPSIVDGVEIFRSATTRREGELEVIA